MEMNVTLQGGPPWGMRLGRQNGTGSTFVAKILPGGRADVEEVKIGDVIKEINGQAVTGYEDVHSKLQAAERQLRLKLHRTREGYHSAVRSEKLSTSVQSSPVTNKKEFAHSSVPSSPLSSRNQTNFHRQVRLDFQGIRGSTENKRRFFETAAAALLPPADRNMPNRRSQPIQQDEAQSESSYGYDSAAGDFAGRAKSRSLASSEGSPCRATEALIQSDDQKEDFDEKTLTEEHPSVVVSTSLPPPSISTVSAPATAAPILVTAPIPAVRKSVPMNSSNSSFSSGPRSLPSTVSSQAYYYHPSTVQTGPYNSNSNNGVNPGMQQSRPYNAQPPPPAAAVTSAGSSWHVRTQFHNDQLAQGNVEVPHRRSVASLRQAITDKLEMKSPNANGNFSGRQRTFYNNNSYEPTPPPWAKSVRVHEFNGIDDNKPYLGRVLDGPVAPEKYFQGVPPPSYNVVQHHGPAPTQPPPQTPPKPREPRITSTVRIPPTFNNNNLLNGNSTGGYRPVHFTPTTTSTSSVAAPIISTHSSVIVSQPTTTLSLAGPATLTNSYPSSSRPTNDLLLASYTINDPRICLEDLDDSASLISSCISTFGDSSEVAGFTNAGRLQQMRQLQQQLAEGQRQQLEAARATNDQLQLNEQSNTAVEPSLHSQTQNHENEQHSEENKATEKEEVKLPPSSLFSQDIILTPFGKPNEPVLPKLEEKPIEKPPVSNEVETNDAKETTPIPAEPVPQPCTPLARPPSNGSMDLESSELLLKSRSPAPFSVYSSASPDHLGTIRKRQHSPVRLSLNETASSPEAFSPAAPIDGRSNDSGYEGSALRSPHHPRPYPDLNMTEKSVECSSNSMFEPASSVSSVALATPDSRQDLSSRPDSFLSMSTFETIEDSNKLPFQASNSSDKDSLLQQFPATIAAALPDSAPVQSQSTPSNRDQWTANVAAENSAFALKQAQQQQNPSELAFQNEIDNLANLLVAESGKEEAGGQGQPKTDSAAEAAFGNGLQPGAQEAEMTSWYKNMFNQMHKIDPQLNDPSVLRYQQRRDGFVASPQPQLQTSKRPLTPSSHVAQPSRFEIEIEPRRARSVGRVVEISEQQQPAVSAENRAGPSTSVFASDSNRFALERARTAHFHLPSYRFRDDDPRPIRCSSTVCGYSARRSPVSSSLSSALHGLPPTGHCSRCGRPTRDPTFEEVEKLYDAMARSTVSRRKGRIEAAIALQCMSEKLDATAVELEQFIGRLDECRRQNDSSGRRLNVKREKEGSPTKLSDEIAELKRISKEELLFRQKAERLAEELNQEKERRHTYTPTATPSLQKNMNRFDTLMRDFAQPQRDSPLHMNPSQNVTAQQRPAVLTATAIYRFEAKSPRELSLNKGDVVRVHREVDAHWLEGERQGKSGIFPASYVQIEAEFERARQKLRVVYPFTARNSNELNLKRGEQLLFRREIDENWMEGSNQIGTIGIFPSSYVRVEKTNEPMQSMSNFDELSLGSAPARPKTPKIEGPSTGNNIAPAPVSDSISHQSGFNFELDRQQQHQQQQQLRNVRFESPPRQHISQSSSFPQQPTFSRDDPLRSKKEEEQVEANRRAASGWRREESLLPAARQQSQAVASSAVDNPNPFRELAKLIPPGSEIYRALYPYEPCREDELQLQIGDLIFVVEHCSDNWKIGTSLRTGVFGTCPGNYLTKH